MTDDDGAVLTLMGWCQTHGKPDHYHRLCRVEYRTGFGVLTRCSCPAHKAENPTVDRDPGAKSGKIGVQSGPESALTDRGQRPHPVREL